MAVLAKVLPPLGMLNALILALLQRYWSSVRASPALQVCFVLIAVSTLVCVVVYVVVFTSTVSLARAFLYVVADKSRRLASRVSRSETTHRTLAPASATIGSIFLLTTCYYYLSAFWCALVGIAVGLCVLCFVLNKFNFLLQTKPGNTCNDGRALCADCQKYNDRLETSLQRELTAISPGLSVRLSPDAIGDQLEGVCPCQTPGSAHVMMTAHVVCNAHYVIDTAYVDGDGRGRCSWVRLPSRLASELPDDFLRLCFVSQPTPAAGRDQATDSVWALLSGQRCMRLLLNSLVCSQTTTSGAVLTRTVSELRGYRDYEIKFRIALEYSGWPRVAKAWIRKARRHLAVDLLRDVIDGGCHLVYEPCGSEQCPDHNYDWRYAFPHAEQVLFDYYRCGRDVTTGCHAAYWACRRVVTAMGEREDRLYTMLLCMLKHVFLYHAQKHTHSGRSRLWNSSDKGEAASQLYRCANEYVCKLLACAETNKLRHYFMPRVNVLEDVGAEELDVYVQVLKLLKANLYRYLHIDADNTNE